MPASPAAAPSVPKSRIWGWMAFDWASQPFNTLGLTFIFGPYFAWVATTYYMGLGMDEDAADAQAQTVWSLAQTIAGLFIAISAPILGAIADRSGRKIPWIVFFSLVFVICSWSTWFLLPDATNLYLVLIVFFIGFIGSESALNFTNAFLPSLGTRKEIGRISGSGAAFGYWGGVVALFIMLLFLAENESGTTFIGLDPPFGLNGAEREGTRAVGPVISIWYVIFMVPFFLYVKDDPVLTRTGPRRSAFASLKDTFVSLKNRASLRNFLIASMLYRDGLNALYLYGGVYAKLVLNWTIIQIGIFGIVSAITAALATWAGGQIDQRRGPMPVIVGAICLLLVVCSIIIGMSRTQIFGIALPDGSFLPDAIFYVCGSIIGGAGGAVYASSRSLMVRHTDPTRPTEAFGLFALSGKATAFLAPAMITLFTWLTQSNQLGFIPVIFFFATGLVMLRWVSPSGDHAP